MGTMVPGMEKAHGQNCIDRSSLIFLMPVSISAEELDVIGWTGVERSKFWSSGKETGPPPHRTSRERNGGFTPPPSRSARNYKWRDKPAATLYGVAG